MRRPLADKNAKIYVAGHQGLVGSALFRRLKSLGFQNLLVRNYPDLDLTDQAAVRRFFDEEKPEFVFLAAAKVGGIYANNTYPADFITANLQIQTHVIESAHRSGVKRLLFLGSSCIYPRLCPQPMKEEHLLTGPLEPTNEPYALAKIAGIVMCRSFNRQFETDFISVMPTNLYGPGDNFHPDNSHVIPALLRRFHEAKEAGAREVVVWGTGTPRREFLHVDDVADACVFLMTRSDAPDLVNIGSGQETTIRELAEAVKETVGFRGELRFDSSKPDGTPRKLLDVSRLSGLGWRPRIGLREGLSSTYPWFVSNSSAGSVLRA
jgi:GDP-L-fucose synthase